MRVQEENQANECNFVSPKVYKLRSAEVTTIELKSCGGGGAAGTKWEVEEDDFVVVVLSISYHSADTLSRGNPEPTFQNTVLFFSTFDYTYLYSFRDVCLLCGDDDATRHGSKGPHNILLVRELREGVGCSWLAPFIVIIFLSTCRSVCGCE